MSEADALQLPLNTALGFIAGLLLGRLYANLPYKR